MANVYAVATGLWSNTATWNTGALPGTGDDVYPNGFTVTIDQDVTILSLRNLAATGISGGGAFTLQAGRTINANIFAGTVNCVNFSQTGTSTINGNLTGGTTGHGVLQSGTSSILNVNGNCTGGSGNNMTGVQLSGTNCTLNITGNCYGGTSNALAGGISLISSTGTVNITGDVFGSGTSSGVYMSGAGTLVLNGNATGGTGASTYGVNINVNGGSVTVNGNVTGGSGGSAFGLANQLAGNVIINGYAIGGAGAQGAINLNVGTMHVTAARGSDVAVYAGVNGSNAGGTTTFERAESGNLGSYPYAGYSKMRLTTNNTVTIRMEDGTFKAIVITDQVASGQPAASDVRAGVSFDFGNKTGSCAVPAANQVAAGVAVDNTVGIAVLTMSAVKSAVLDADVSTLTVANSIGERLKNCATVESTGAQITSLNP